MAGSRIKRGLRGTYWPHYKKQRRCIKQNRIRDCQQMPPTLDFWFDFASTYSFLSAKRIGPLAAAAGVAVNWRPFLLGPIFQAQGWSTSPFHVYPAKGRYMVRDIQRIAAERGLTFKLPELWPANSVKAARLALAAAELEASESLGLAIFEAAFERGEAISNDAVLQQLLINRGHDSARLIGRSHEQEIKDRLRANTAEASKISIFGAPAFTTSDGELFWGDDRLEQALRWAAKI
jgi:2-hydroxychromene-2-carboxylate isomerase